MEQYTQPQALADRKQYEKELADNPVALKNYHQICDAVNNRSSTADRRIKELKQKNATPINNSPNAEAKKDVAKKCKEKKRQPQRKNPKKKNLHKINTLTINYKNRSNATNRRRKLLTQNGYPTAKTLKENKA